MPALLFPLTERQPLPYNSRSTNTRTLSKNHCTFNSLFFRIALAIVCSNCSSSSPVPR